MTARTLAALAAALAACARPAADPTVTHVVPDRGPADRDVGVVISGTRLEPLLLTDFSRRGSSVLDAAFSARLGREPLREVRLNDDGTLSATVPAGLLPGTYPLTVVVPGGATASLPGAYRVLAPNEVLELVAGFRFDPIGPQQIGVPFRITATAVDAQGAAVDAFSDTVQLADLTGTVVPARIGPFARGAWTGQVEVRALLPADTLTATSSAGKGGTSAPFDVTAGAATRLAFATPPRSLTAGACSPPLTVQLVDATATPSPAAAAVPLTLRASPTAGFALFSDPACTAPLAALTIPRGGASATLFVSGTRAGPVQLAATAMGLLPAMQTQTVSPGPPQHLAFLTADPTLNSGTCSNEVQLQLRDAYDNAAPAAASTVVALDVTPAQGLELFAADSCSTALTSLTLAAGVAQGELRMRGGPAGAFTLTASSAGLASAMLRVRVNPAGFPTQLVIVSAPQTVPVGTCSGPLAVQSQDASGNPVASPGAVPVSLAASPATGFAFFLDDVCTMPMATLTLGGATNTRIVYFKGTTAGAVSVTAASAGLQGGAQTQTLTPGPPAGLTFLSAAQSVASGACSGELRVGLTDSLANATTAPALVTLSFAAAPPPGVTFFADAACTLPSSTVDVPGGDADGRLYFSGTVAGVVTVTASSPGLSPAQQTEAVGAGAPAAVVFVSAPQTVAVNACSAAATVELRDAFGNRSTAAAATAVALSATPGAGLTFFSDPACATVAGSVPLAALASSASFFFRGTSPSTPTVTATVPALTPGQQVETIVAGAPARLAFTTDARTVPAATCSGPVTIEVQDASSNPSPVPAARPVSVSAPGLTFYADAACATSATGFTVPMGGTSGTLYFRSDTAAAYPAQASSAGLSSAAQTETVTAAAADRLAFVTPPRAATAGACSAAVTIARRDPYGNDAVGPAASVSLAAAPSAGFTFYSDAACTTAVTQVSLAGAASLATFFFVGTVATAEMLTVTSALLLPAAQAATVSPAATPTQLVFTTPARSAVAGSCSAELTVQARDGFSNPRPVAMATAVALAGAATFYADSGCTASVAQVSISAGADSASFWFRATAAGPLPLTATAAGLNPAAQTEVVAAAAPDRLVFISPPQTLGAGACSAPATVEPRDPFGNVSGPAAAQTVSLSAAGGGGVTFYSDPACATAVGSVPLGAGATWAGFYFRGTQAGARTLEAAVALWAKASQPATFAAGPPAQLAFTTPAHTVASGACSPALTVEARDAFGNTATASSAITVDLAAAPAAGFAFHSDAACGSAVTGVQLPALGSAATFWVMGGAAQAVSVTASAIGLTAAVQVVTVTAGVPAAIAFVTPARTATAGACSAVLTVELRDAAGNLASSPGGLSLTLAAAPALGFVFHANAGCSMASPTAGVTPGGTQASFYFRGTNAGTVAVTVSAAGLVPSSQSQAVSAGGATSFQWDPVPGTVALSTPFGVTVRARDAFGNLADGYAGTAALSLAPAGAVACTSACTDGTTTDVFAAGVWSGTVTVSGAAAVGSGRTLTATSGAASGTSDAFSVSGMAARSPPIARFIATPNTINVGGTVTLDASASTDWQTPAAALEVSWDWGNDTFTPFSTAKTLLHTYAARGLYHVKLKVRDADGDVDYRSAWVRVFAAGDSRCTVTTNTDVDDGAMNCGGQLGADGRLSLREAIRLTNAGQANDIVFSAPMTITGAGAYSISRSVDIFAPTGTIIVGKTLQLPGNNDTVRVFGLELTGQTAPIAITGNNAHVSFWDVYLHDLPGIADTRSDLDLNQVRMVGCTGPCVSKTGSNPGLVTIRGSELRDSPGQAAVQFSGCSGTQLLDMYATSLSNLAFGVQATCDGSVQVRNNTFDGVATAIALTSGGGNRVTNNVITNAGTTAATCGSATFAARGYHLLFGNASNGCLASDPNTLLSDPAFAFRSAGDYRLSFGSPAIDSGFDTGLDLVFTLPGNYLGAGPDRGGRESY